MTAVPDRQFGAIERTLAVAAEASAGPSVGGRAERFLIAAGGALGRIAVGAAAITAVANELGVPASVTAEEFYRTEP